MLKKGRPRAVLFPMVHHERVPYMRGESNGADGENRTLMTLRSHAPEAPVRRSSANFVSGTKVDARPPVCRSVLVPWEGIEPS